MKTLMPMISAPFAAAEQKVTVNGYEVHYIVLPTTFLNSSIASQYRLPRGRDRALINVSILDPTGNAITANVVGSSRNLLEQKQQFEFREIVEGDAIYYLAVMRHADEEHHRFHIEVELPDSRRADIRFQQKMYWEE